MEEALQKLYAKIPKMPSCIGGCDKCCGQVPMLPVEAEKLGLDYCATPINEDLKCELFKEGKCSVYEDRPFTCRIFNGANDGCWLTCPEMDGHGPLNQFKGDLLYAEYFDILEMHSDEDKARFEKAYAESEKYLVENSRRNGW